MTEVQEKQLQRYRYIAELICHSIPETPRVIPMIRYWDRMVGRYENHHGERRISLPTPEEMAFYHGETLKECLDDHESLFLHELAHWGTEGEGHTARMYAFQFALAKMFGHPVMEVRKAEIEYKPRAAKASWRRYLRTFREEPT